MCTVSCLDKVPAESLGHSSNVPHSLRDSSGSEIVYILLPELFKKTMKQKTITSILAAIVLASTVLLTPSLAPALAQTGAPPVGSTGDAAQEGLSAIGQAYPPGARTTDANIQNIAKKIIDWALYLAAIIAVIFIIIGGFLYITSAGDPGRATKGRNTLVNALIGLAIVVLSYLIVQVVYNFLTR